MKLSRKTSKAIGCLWLIMAFLLTILQIVFLTMKISGSVDWSWLTTLIPLAIVLLLPLIIVIGAVLALIPAELWKVWKTKKRVDKEAKKYGMERQPGESTGDLKKRIVRRNMLCGDYSRKDVKDMILEAFPMVGSCPIYVSNDTKEVVLIPVSSWQAVRFTDDELREIAEFAAKYIPIGYTVTARNAYTNEAKEGETRDNANADSNS